MMSQNLTLHDKLATVLVKFSCDASQPSRKYPSRAPPPPPPLIVVFRNSSSQSCEPTLRGAGWRDLYSPRNDPDPEIIPKLTPK